MSSLQWALSSLIVLAVGLALMLVYWLTGVIGRVIRPLSSAIAREAPRRLAALESRHGKDAALSAVGSTKVAKIVAGGAVSVASAEAAIPLRTILSSGLPFMGTCRIDCHGSILLHARRSYTRSS